MKKLFKKGECQVCITGGEGLIEKFLIKQGFVAVEEPVEVEEKPKKKRKKKAE